MGSIRAYNDQTIVALCTPRGAGAVALLRVSGDDALTIVAHISRLTRGARITDVATHTIHMGYVLDEHDEPIDQVMFSVMHAPSTFTGEHVVEITTHNNPFIIQAVIDRVIASGARLAREGEFCKRAVLHGKLDIVQAESINELIHANTAQAVKQSLAQVRGSLSEHITTMHQQLIHALALCQASFEFLDDESVTFEREIVQIVNGLLEQITQIGRSHGQQERIRNGLRIALIGAVNAGKSTLFNALLCRDRAIVTNIAGTTRDSIEAGVYEDQSYWTFVDTAGLRQTDDVIEQQGIDRTYQEAVNADIVLLAIDGSRDITAQEKVLYTDLLTEHSDKIILVCTKSDKQRVCTFTVDNVPACSVSHEQQDTLRVLLRERTKQLLSTHDTPLLINVRQHALMLAARDALDKAAAVLSAKSVAYELLAIHLQEAAEQLGEVTGKTISEAGMDAVFTTFCVGK